MWTRKLITMFRLLILTVAITLHFTATAQVVNIPNRRELPDSIFHLLQNYRAILLGEIHGTEECLELTEGFVRLWTSHNMPLLLGLEIAESNQPFVDSFLQTKNTVFLKRMLFFKNNFEDGRASVAMFELLKTCATIPELKILCFDTDHPIKSNAERDSLMAVNIVAAIKKDADRTFISLSGNVHAALSSNKGYLTMGAHLANSNLFADSTLAALNINLGTGTAWLCTVGPCGIQTISDSNTTSLFTNDMETYFSQGEHYQWGSRYTGAVYIKHCHASFPFKE